MEEVVAFFGALKRTLSLSLSLVLTLTLTPSLILTLTLSLSLILTLTLSRRAQAIPARRGPAPPRRQR